MTQIDLFQKESTSSHLDSLASRGASQASQKIFNRRKKTLATSGRGLLTLLNKKDPNISFLKMFLTSQDWGGLMNASLIWRIKITQRQHLVFQLTQVQERLTKENGSGSTQKIWPTPRVSDTEGGVVKNVELKNGTFSRVNKEGVRWGVKLKDAVAHMEEKMWPTPTTMDSKEDSLKHATKMLQGKTHRSSGQPIQKTLSDKVMMEEIIKNPELMELYQDHQMEERPNLPKQQEFVEYLRQNTTIKELASKTDIKRTTIEHWFRKDKAGFSHPSIEDWEKIKPHLKTIKFDREMTTVTSKEWTTKEKLLPTTIADDVKNVKLNPKRFQGQLDPNFVRWLMGYPPGWVDLENMKDLKKNPKE